MADLLSWASARWDARTAVDDDYTVELPDGTLSLQAKLQETQERREAMFAALGSLGADAGILRELDELVAAAGVTGVLIGAHFLPDQE